MFDDEDQPLFIGQDFLILDFKVKSCSGHDEHLGIFADCLADDFFQAADPEGVIGGCGTHSEIGEYHIHILFNPEQYVEKLTELAQIARKNGLLALEEKAK